MSRDFNTNTNNADEWLTPPYITDALGPFDLDPCQPIDPPFTHALIGYNVLDDGLAQTWRGRVWCNPPYGRETFKWLDKLATHGNGMSLIFARTETIGFHAQVWQRADAVFFFKGRLKFHYVTGEPAAAANAPSCLVAYGANNVEALKRAADAGDLLGKLVTLTDAARMGL
jgi:hypothetical protein